VDETLTINLTDTGDNYPICYTLSSKTTKEPTTGWHLVEIRDLTFKEAVAFRYAILPEVIQALQRIQSHIDSLA